MSSSEDEAPEVVSRATARSTEAAKQNDLRAFKEAEAGRRKARNRARAQHQKERADNNDALSRMERAMRDAEDEDEDEDEEADEDGEEDEEDGDEGQDDDADEDEGEDGDDDDEEMDSVDGSDDNEDAQDNGESSDESSDSNMQPSYLPDHLFKDALASVKPPKPPTKTPSRAEKKRQKAKAKRRRKNAKDVLIGDRTVRVLDSAAQTARSSARRTLAPPSANKFVKKSLLLKKSDRKRDWERGPADMARSRSQRQPLRNFVRGS